MAKTTAKPTEDVLEISEQQPAKEDLKEDLTVNIQSQIQILKARIEDLQKARSQVTAATAPTRYADKSVEEIQQIGRDNALEQLAANNQIRAFDEAITSAHAQITSLMLQLGHINQQQRVQDGLNRLKKQAQIADQKLAEAMNAVLEVKAIAASIGRDCLEVNGRIPFENRWDLTAGFPQVEIYDKCVVLNSQLFPIR